MQMPTCDALLRDPSGLSYSLFSEHYIHMKRIGDHLQTAACSLKPSRYTSWTFTVKVLTTTSNTSSSFLKSNLPSQIF